MVKTISVRYRGPFNCNFQFELVSLKKFVNMVDLLSEEQIAHIKEGFNLIDRVCVFKKIKTDTLRTTMVD
jgi:hypothetical protein